MRYAAGLQADWMSRFSARSIGRFLALAALLGSPALLAQPAAPEAETARCDQTVAEFVDVRGLVEYRSVGGASWLTATAGDRLCAGDTLRVSAFGQTRVRLADDTMLSFDRNTSAIVGEASTTGDGTLIDLLRGLIHVISRDPRSLRFNTPYFNAGLEGTEFTITVAETSGEIAVIEGAVAMTNDHGAIELAAGARGIATTGVAPRAEGAIDSSAALAWTAHIPEISPTPSVAADAADAPAPLASAAFYAARADARLRFGLVELARADIAESLSREPDHALALALRALIELGSSDREGARETIAHALETSPSHVPTLLASSYVALTDNDLAAANAAVDRALALEPDNPLAVARKAELLVAGGDAEAGLTAADRAIALAPDHARAEAVRGFAFLMQGRSAPAVDAFSRAVRLDSRLPLARVGLALAYVRTGDIAAGRRALEVAVALDPRNAVLRSYVAKTYAAQNRSELSDTQLELARRFDALDPTPWLYGAVTHQQRNESIRALWELERAGPASLQVRSSLALDEDHGARSLGLGRLYRSLAFNRLAMQRGTTLVDAAPADYAGHQLLADIYSVEPRHQIARVNAQQTAQLLRPLNVFPVQPQAAETNLFLIDQLGPSELASTDLGVPFTRNGVRIEGSGITATNDTRGAEVAIAGLVDRLSFSAGLVDYATDGFRENNDFSQRTANALVQYRASEATSWQVELRSNEIDHGDIALLFDPDNFLPFQRVDERNDSIRFGVHHVASPRTTWLALVSGFDGETGLSPSPFFRFEGDTRGYSADLQRIFTGERWRLVTGLRHYDADRKDTNSIIDFPIPEPPFVFSSVETIEFDQRHSTAYVYGARRLGTNVELTLGAELADLSTDRNDIQRTLPRLGLKWQLAPRTELHLSVGEHLIGPFVSKFNIDPTIAPTSVVGFNYYYFGSEGEESQLHAVGLTHEFSERLYAGVETIRRDIDIPTTVSAPITTIVDAPIDINRNETMTRGYVYWTPTSQIGLSVEYLDDEFDNEGIAFGDNYAWLDTERLPITLSLFKGPRLSTRVRATYVRQSGLFTPFDVTQSELYEASDRFWVADLEIGYRLPKRRGTLELIVANALDEQFRFQDVDPENPRIMPERIASLRFTVAY